MVPLMSSSENNTLAATVPLSQRAAALRPMPYLDGLNPEQRKAVETLDGPVLMLAGAGTGKTRALTARIAHLISTGRATPRSILAVTFTNKAAREMRERVSAALGHPTEGMAWLGTFHSICVKLLRRHAELVGLKSNFTILDTDDQIRLLKQLIEAEGIDAKRWPPRMLAGIIDHWKNRAWRPDTLPAAESGAFNGKGPKLYALYQQRLAALNACDFGDLLLHMVTIFQAHEDVLQQYQRQFAFILVDEYQDTNVAQYLWLRLLAQGHSNLCVVGDDDQSIYGWRGAEVGNILRFEADFKGAAVIRLEQNYRSTGHILKAASAVIAGNSQRLGKELWTEGDDGAPVRLIGHWDGEEEARWIGEEIEALGIGTRGLRAIGPEEIAILVRASHQMRAFEDRFLTIGLPYRVIGGPRFYERLEIRDAMAYFRLVISPEDDLAFERIVNTPKRGLGDKAQATIHEIARRNGVSLLQGAAMAVESGAIGGKGGKELARFVLQIAHWRNLMREGVVAGPATDDLIERENPEGLSHIELAETILEESGYTAMWQNDKTPEAPGRLENLKELVKALEQFENLQGFLEHVSLIMDNEQDDGQAKVTLMTLHAAKGLEYPAVFLPGWEDGLFPSQRAMDEEGIKGLEEERRLAYVGVTRAEELCTISFAGNRRVYGQWQSQMPSRFIDELPEAHVEILTPPGLYGHQSHGMGQSASPVSQMQIASNLPDRAAQADAYNSPGWRRLQARQGEYGLSQPRESKRAGFDEAATVPFDLGERVFHQKFGYGAITAIEGDKLDVAFDKAGVKKVVARFVVAADSAGDQPF